MTWKGCEMLTPLVQPGLGWPGGAACAEGEPCHSRPGTAASLSQSLPHASGLAFPCLSFPPLLHSEPLAPNCLILGEPEVLFLVPLERGRWGALGAETPLEREEAPVPSRGELRCVTLRGGRAASPAPALQPTLRGTTDPLPRWAREGLAAPSAAISPLGRVSAALSCPPPAMAAERGARPSAPSPPPTEHGRGGGRSGGGAARGCRHWKAAGMIDGLGCFAMGGEGKKEEEEKEKKSV